MEFMCPSRMLRSLILATTFGLETWLSIWEVLGLQPGRPGGSFPAMSKLNYTGFYTRSCSGGKVSVGTGEVGELNFPVSLCRRPSNACATLGELC